MPITLKNKEQTNGYHQNDLVCVQLLLCLILICIIVLQSGKNSGLSAFTGANESYLAKNKAKSRDARLALATKWVAGVFVLLTVVLNLI